ncbi:MAG: hypothetical protein OEV08_14595 [Nitrospira sp.]|nr:hypothetical protein [Nitrospira sp.]
MPSGTFRDESRDARELLISTYASGTEPFGAGTVAMPTIDGEVLVGKESSDTIDEVGRNIDLSKNDLIFGEGGNDFIQGAGGADVLYGGAGEDRLYGDAGNDFLFGGDEKDALYGGDGVDALFGGDGNDTLVGGAGDDKLAGGAGNDTYYINSLTDGNDTIEDSDATGVIKVDGRVLTGGIKKAGDATWKSPDGQFEYRLEAGHLKLTLNGSTLTINENFQSGQFGIRSAGERMAA